MVVDGGNTRVFVFWTVVKDDPVRSVISTSDATTTGDPNKNISNKYRLPIVCEQ